MYISKLDQRLNGRMYELSFLGGRGLVLHAMGLWSVPKGQGQLGIDKRVDKERCSLNCGHDQAGGTLCEPPKEDNSGGKQNCAWPAVAQVH